MNASEVVPGQSSLEEEILEDLVQSIVENPRRTDPEMGIKHWQITRIIRDCYQLVVEDELVRAVVEDLGERGVIEVFRDNVCYGSELIRVDLVARPVAGRESCCVGLQSLAILPCDGHECLADRCGGP